MNDIPGIRFVTEAVRLAYGATDRLDFRSPLPPEQDPHPAKLVTAWSGPGHWQLVTCGLTELFEKTSSLPDQNGWGCELTMKVPRAEGDLGPPRYAVELLRWLVDYVESSGRPFRAGHYVQIGPLARDATLVGVTFVRDTRLPDLVSSPFGRFYFLQAVGVTADELEAIARADDGRVVRALAATRPDLLTEPFRASIFQGPHAPPFPGPPQGGTVAVASMRLSVLRVSRSFLGGHECELSQQQAPQVARLLQERLGRGLALQLSDANTVAHFRPAATPSWRYEDAELLVEFTPGMLAELCAGLVRAEDSAPISLSELPELTFRCVRR